MKLINKEKYTFLGLSATGWMILITAVLVIWAVRTFESTPKVDKNRLEYRMNAMTNEEVSELLSKTGRRYTPKNDIDMG